MIQMIKTMKIISWSIKRHGDVSITIGAFADMDRLPESDEMVAHPSLLVLQKISVDEDAILPYFPNLMTAVHGELNATPFIMAHNIPFHELQDRVVLHNYTSLLATENRLFDCLLDAMKDQYQAMYAFMDHISPHSNEPTRDSRWQRNQQYPSSFERTNYTIVSPLVKFL
jgi:hypothetical protein